MKLPASAIVIVLVVVLVLVAVTLFFVSTTGSKISEAEADRIFAEQCLEVCRKTQKGGITFLMKLPESNPQFMQACQTKYGAGTPGTCVANCGPGCKIEKTSQQQLCEKAQAYPGTDFLEKCKSIEPQYASLGASCEKC